MLDVKMKFKSICEKTQLTEAHLLHISNNMCLVFQRGASSYTQG